MWSEDVMSRVGGQTTRTRSTPHCGLPRWAPVLATCLIAALGLAPRAEAITILWQSANTTITLGMSASELEYENPLSGSETVGGYRILEWRDADYAAPAWYDDWTVSHPGVIDGNANEIWMRALGHRIWTSTSVPSSIISIHLTGDSNDGLANVLVDNTLVAQLDMGSNPIDRAFIVVTGLPSGPHQIQVNDMGFGQMGTDVHTFGAAVLSDQITLTKWSQPPDLAQPVAYYGWNDYSAWWYGPVVADDWLCTTPDPVTDVHWWGSFIGWKYAWPPQLPQHFHIQFWTDVPAVPGDPSSFSHPGQVVGEAWAYNYTYEFAGWDFDPRMQEYEACFKFNYVLNPSEYFYQNSEPPGNIYWISIAACEGGPSQLEYPFGWKTRPRNPGSMAPDAAVRIYDPVQPVYGSQYAYGYPIYWPNEGDAWDMAFELTTNRVQTKLVQPPDLEFTGIDVHATSQPAGEPPYILADDFPCTTTGPLTRIEIWGSWRYDQLPVPNDPGQVVFTLSIHADSPAGPGYSMPGDVLWWREFSPGDFTWQTWATGLQEGWLDPPSMYDPLGDTVCYRYAFVLNPGEFTQQGTPEEPVVYWLDVQAHPVGTVRAARFGWKTSFQHWNDDAVWGQGAEPYYGPWYELRYPPMHPYYPASIDLAFVIYGQGPENIKWSQPPQPYTPEDAYNGWDQYSMDNLYQIAADDWRCDTDNPVTDIHWWGSFIGWYHPYVPPQGMPQAFHLAIWTDVPADPADPASFSHPGRVVWENTCSTYEWEFAGWDFDPRILTRQNPPPEATFKFSQYLDPNDWFWQELGGNIYWLSIAAIYSAGPQIDYSWGWKTRPRDGESPAPDDAVWISEPTKPYIDVWYQNGGPIYYPTPADSWDLAFELTSVPRDRVVCEPQGAVNNPFHPPTYWYDVTIDDPGLGRCDFHVRVYDPNPANYTNVSLPPTWQFAVHQVGTEWWASWWDPDCSDALFNTTFRFQFDNPNRSTWGNWTTTISWTSDPYAQVVDRSENHAQQIDGWGYRVHVPRPTEYIKWPQPPTEDPRYPGYFYGWNELSVYLGPQVVADNWLCCDQHRSPTSTGGARTSAGSASCRPRWPR